MGEGVGARRTEGEGGFGFGARLSIAARPGVRACSRVVVRDVVRCSATRSGDVSVRAIRHIHVPRGGGVQHGVARDGAQGGGHRGIQASGVSRGHRGSAEERAVEHVRGEVGARHGRMAAIAHVERDLRVGVAHHTPRLTHRRHIAIVRFGEVHVVVIQALLHACIGAHVGEVIAVQRIPVLAPPGHVEHRIGAFIVRFDRIHQSGRTCIASGDLGWQSAELALLLQDHIVPRLRGDGREGGLIGGVLGEAVSSRSGRSHGHVLSQGKGQLPKHVRQVVAVDVAVADEEYACLGEDLRWK